MRNKATKKNMDLDLRRYGKMLYTKAEESGGSDGGGSADINTILDNISIKDDLLTKLQAIDYTSQDEDYILTNLTFDDVFNDYDDFIKSWLCREEYPLIGIIHFPQTVMRDNNYLKVEITDEDSTYYDVKIANEDSNINIYVYMESGNPK